MVTMLLAAMSLGMAPATADLTPSDDVWVYPHATDPQKDPFLRAWGGDEGAVAPDADSLSSYSYSYIKWDLAGIPAGAKLTEAKLILTHVAGAGYTVDYSKAHPLEARPLLASFTEKSWTYEKASTLSPEKGAKAIYGSIYPEKITEDEKPFKLTIDLLKGPKDFKKAFIDASASSDRAIALALTSSTNPEEEGMKAVYKLYSKDAESAENRPVLHVAWE